MVAAFGRLRRPLRCGAALLLLLALPVAALAQSTLRNTFPGRRIGGGTRGECSARLLAHLVPSNSVFAPGASAAIALLEGPTAQPRPLELTFRPLTNAGTAASAQASTSTRNLPAAPAGVVLLTLPPVKTPLIWESGYRCDGGGDGGSGGGGGGGSVAADPLDFVQTAAPPAVSLLVPDAVPGDAPIQASLKALRAQCGRTVTTASLARTFGLEDVVTLDWPQQLPVRCP
jgi:hypothetical protein